MASRVNHTAVARREKLPRRYPSRTTAHNPAIRGTSPIRSWAIAQGYPPRYSATKPSKPPIATAADIRDMVRTTIP